MAVASASASNAAKGIVPPASAFAELLRRSRFASYDPAIAQTYTAPPAYARRGNYGLKRPIPMPYKDSYISLPTFEHHAHFTEWNNAEAQVRFVKRFEEMGIHPRPFPNAAWEKGLGEAKTQWLIDSEFAEHTYVRNGPPEETTPPRADEGSLDAYGKQGRGGYGPRRPPPKPASYSEPDGNHAQPNIEAMTPHQFRRYLQKIRELGPEFRAYLIDQHRSRLATQLRAAAKAKGLPPPTQEEIDAQLESETDDLLLYIASQNSSQKLHRRFLGKHFSKDYTSPESNKIEGQPHRNGALAYTHLSPLDSILTTQPQPGLVLQVEPKHTARYSDTNTNNNAQDYVALFGGIVAKLHSRNAGVRVPLYNPDNEAPVAGGNPQDPGSLEKSISGFRMTRVAVRTVPKVVSYAAHKMRPKELLDTVKLDSECITEFPWSQRNLVNPYRPGSYEYTVHQSVTPSRYHYGKYVPPGAASGANSFARLQQKEINNKAKRTLKGFGGNGNGNGNGKVATDANLNQSVVKTLRNMIAPSGGSSERGL